MNTPTRYEAAAVSMLKEQGEKDKAIKEIVLNHLDKVSHADAILGWLKYNETNKLFNYNQDYLNNLIIQSYLKNECALKQLENE